MSPVLADIFSTTESPRKPHTLGRPVLKNWVNTHSASKQDMHKACNVDWLALMPVPNGPCSS